jgi:hypothetical protein
MLTADSFNSANPGERSPRSAASVSASRTTSITLADGASSSSLRSSRAISTAQRVTA